VLGVTHPGGRTPTGPTLRHIAATPGAFGLDATDRPNVVLLITDGMANADDAANIQAVDGGVCGAGTSDADAACKVNSAIHALHNLTPPVTTYVVGFSINSEQVTGYLKCHAVVAGTSRCDENVDLSNCGEGGTPNCHYRADNAAELSGALAEIAGRVASCTYRLDGAVADVSRLYVYFDFGGGTLPVFLPRDTSHQDRWDFDLNTQTLTFFGPACDTLRDPSVAVTPLVIFGCPDTGG
jgi:hypothetical protein